MQKKPQQSITAFFAPANVRSSRVQPEPKRKLSETPPNEPKKAKSSSEESVGEDSPPWLREPRDKDKRAPEHPQFDCRTLYIPPEAFRSMTPAKEQFWRMKQEHMDHVLFFKMGKFYELFYMDAEVGHRELGLVWMGTKEPHVGFPEAAFSKYAEKLVHLGYKVCRVEQTETPEQLKERNRSTSGKKAKVVSREIVSVLTKGTLMDPELIGNDHFSYLCCVDEEHDTVGLCLVDCSTSFVLVKQFQDSSTRATLKGILASLNICEFVFLKDRLSPASLAALKSRDSNAILNAVNHESELWTSSAFLDVIKQKNHFGNPDMAEFIQELIALEFFIGISALGASVWYLNKVMRDQEVFGVASFAHRGTFSSGGSQPMVLDGQTLRNLEILENCEGSSVGSLLSYLDHCVSPFGRRMLRTWLTAPLQDIEAINTRLNAVESLVHNPSIVSKVRDNLRSLPDLERLQTWIHSFSVARDKKAVMFENIIKKKIKTLLSFLEGLRHARDMIEMIRTDPMMSALSNFIRKDLDPQVLSRVSAIIETNLQAFDWESAVEQGCIVPERGQSIEYDKALQEISEIEERLEEELDKTQELLKDKSIRYASVNREEYQLEIKTSTLNSKDIPDEYELTSQKTGFKRFTTARIQELVSRLELARSSRDSCLREVSRQVFEGLGEHHMDVRKLVSILASLDCILSLAVVSGSDSVFTRPHLLLAGDAGAEFLEFRSCQHPSLMSRCGTAPVIPNDIVLGTGENAPTFTIVTGPNMGGKSTLLRQTCLIVILAQLGCFVPAAECVLTPVDRIFTRIGAQDRIFEGKSTFFVELEETAAILNHATSKSLVILDELGRGTSTFDGISIAYGVADHIRSKIRCRCLFSTHYHMLCHDLAGKENVSLYHMSCSVSRESREITFDYKFLPGVCNKSFGINVAHMAGLPEMVTARAEQVSKEFETKFQQRKLDGSMS